MSELDKAPSLNGKIEVLSGFAFPSSGFNQLDGMPLIRIRDLGGRTTEVRFRGAYDTAYRVTKGDLLVGMDGDFEVYRWEGDDALLNQRVCKILSASRDVDQGFLYWYLKPKIAEIHRRTPQTTVRHLSTKDIYAIAEPPVGFPEQEVIAQILDTLDTAICETEALIDKLKAVKQGLLHDLLTRGIDANGQLRPPQSEAPQLYKESPLGWIPREWELSPLGNISSRIGDGVHYAVERSHDGVPFLFVSCVRNGKIDWQGASFVPPKTYLEISKRSKPVKGMVLFTVVGSYGHAAHVDDELDFGFERNIAFVIPNSKYLHSRYLFYSVSSEAARTQVERLVIGNAQKVLTLAALNSIVVPLPSLSEQAQIISRLDALNERQEHEQFAFEKLLVQRKGLMDDLLTGRVRVTPLLESIQQTAAQTGA
jgi:type I restriction enzyme S subunit